MLNTMRRHGTILALFAAGTTALSAAVYTLTKDTIAEQAALVQKKLLDQVVPNELYDNDLAQECYLVSNERILGNKQPRRLYIARKNGEPVAAALETTAPDGYSGSIHLLVGADFKGTVLGVRVTEHHETPGLGDKIETRISDWITHFSGKKMASDHDPKWAVKKDGGEFDQFTGATITPRAVVNATKRTAVFMQLIPQELSNYPICGDE
ncbi:MULTISPECIES: electron transport complex subunit RsxG [Providencia]|uniref:Ion-translocating oxidoreductase complex subunit G n=1 Tax=Providencia heimbachae ATCC 35613 TaxID=1354272 RepID=A0A1B7K4H2_9GAMM|nr:MULTISPECIES: electron transport complex subunit RsxG [Providencia]MBP6121480.1 electron transport complex subunit RsxG [Providencia sp.]NIH22668.1 electron transport complex subunit RsxG [Providencia heimbachae]OAT55042.1 RnfG family electron transport complex protein [Providencia heimbachae ATCC 35613]QCJ70024.1 electron transport complex subunit RsxG [Providencia heimbachae]SQH13229.1 electron transport complex protein RnfG [Providencia heimbachae]